MTDDDKHQSSYKRVAAALSWHVRIRVPRPYWVAPAYLGGTPHLVARPEWAWKHGTICHALHMRRGEWRYVTPFLGVPPNGVPPNKGGHSKSGVPVFGWHAQNGRRVT